MASKPLFSASKGPATLDVTCENCFAYVNVGVDFNFRMEVRGADLFPPLCYSTMVPCAFLLWLLPHPFGAPFADSLPLTTVATTVSTSYGSSQRFSLSSIRPSTRPCDVTDAALQGSYDVKLLEISATGKAGASIGLKAQLSGGCLLHPRFARVRARV